MINTAHKTIGPLLRLLPVLSILSLFLLLPTPTRSASLNVTATVPDSTATFSGFAPVGSIVLIKENGFIVGSVVTGAVGTFSKSVVGTPGNHAYSIFLTDNEGRSTPEVNLGTVVLTTQTDTSVPNINLPPTISITKTQIGQGDIVSVFGQSAPGSTVDLYQNGVKRFVAVVGSDSKWRFDLNDAVLADNNDFYAINRRSGAADSAKSFVVNLKVLACLDANCDRTSPPPAVAPPATATSSGGLNVNVDLGGSVGNWILLTSIFSAITLLLILLLLIFLWIASRRKKKKDLLEELENKVEKDLQIPNPISQIRSDFEETKKEL